MSVLAPDITALDDRPIIRVWRHRSYARFMLGLGPYYVTSWMQRIAIGWLGWELSHSHAWVDAIAAADLAPMLVLGPLAGAVADRCQPVQLMQRAQLVLIVQAIMVAAFALSGAMTVWLLFALSLVSGCVQPVFTAARQTLVPSLVPRTDLASAVSIDASLFHGSRFIGPALAAFAIPLIGIGGTCAVHVLGCCYFSAMVACITASKPQDSRQRRQAGLLTEIAEGVGYVRRHRGFFPLFAMMMVASILARPLQDLLPGFAGEVFQAGASGLAWLTSSMGVGSLSAAVFVALRGRGDGLPSLAIVAFCALAFATFGFVATRHLAYAVAFSTMFGFTLTLMGVSIQALAQIAVADDLRGRVMSLYALVFRGFPAIGAVLIGGLAEHIGLRSVFALSAAMCLLAWLLVAPHDREIEAAVRSSQ